MFRSTARAAAVASMITAAYLVFGSTVRIQAQRQSAPSETIKVNAGHEVFNKNCLQCHAVFAGQYSFGPNLAGETRKASHKMTANDIRTIIENGKGKMPPMKNKVTALEMDNLIAYIRTL